MNKDTNSQQTSTSNIHRKSLWQVRAGAIIWFVLTLGFLLSLPILLDASILIIFVLLALSCIIAIPITFALRAALRGLKQSSPLNLWGKTSIATLLILASALALPIYYLAIVTETRPTTTPQATLTNGQKVVVFQGMQHFASDNFYKSVIFDVEKAISEGYVIFYEGVQTRTPESKEFFAKLSAEITGSEDLEGFYRAMGQACGMNFQQDYFTILERDQSEHRERHFIADVDALELKDMYEQLLKNDTEFADAHKNDFSGTSSNNFEAFTKATQWLESGTEGQKKLAGVICRGVMTLSMGRNEGNAGLFSPLILDYRNRTLMEYIISSHHDKIFVTYGANHLAGVFQLLKERDPSWQIANVKWLRTIEPPTRDYEGELKIGSSN